MAKLTIKAKVTDDSRHKLEALGREYHAFQAYLHADKTVNLYSATRQQADRLLARIKRPKKGRQYPLILRRDRINVQNDSKFPNTYWMKIPIYPKSIHVRIRADSRHDLTQYQLREAKVIRQRDDWYVFLCIEKESPSPKQPTSILAIDLGVRHIAVTTNTANTRPNFYGHKLRLIRGFHFWLRRKLGQKKAFHKIKELKDREFLQVNHELHQISKAIVEEANRTNSVIVVGKLKGIRQKLNAGRRIRRLVNNFPYFRLVQYIKYKAEWAGVRVMDISEAHTSQTCHNCFNRSRTARKTQGLYRCTNCGREFNADENGSRNILQRALGVLSNVGGLLTCRIEPLVIAERSKVITEEPLTPSVGRMSETKERNEIGERFD